MTKRVAVRLASVIVRLLDFGQAENSMYAALV